ncbi:MAG: putative transposase, partial [Acidimicrobiaceae bacterium]|nr:putative transposase [Acidimicrobiaceae bacterium]
GRYLASISTMYRALRANDEIRERRRQATHPARVRPELVARHPNEVWSWDITKLKGPSKGVYFDCYVIIDIFSRKVIAWMVAPTETAELAKAFIADAIKSEGITADMLSIHADRGTSMTSKPVAILLAELGVARSHSRPHVSNDNPYSEAAFIMWVIAVKRLVRGAGLAGRRRSFVARSGPCWRRRRVGVAVSA